MFIIIKFSFIKKKSIINSLIVCHSMSQLFSIFLVLNWQSEFWDQQWTYLKYLSFSSNENIHNIWVIKNPHILHIHTLIRMTIYLSIYIYISSFLFYTWMYSKSILDWMWNILRYFISTFSYKSFLFSTCLVI